MRRTALWTGTLLISVILCLLVAEAVARLSGRAPWIGTNLDAREPIMHAPHPQLGWKAKEGSFIAPPWDPSGTDARFTFDSRGRRRTRSGEKPPGNEMIIVGGSFAQGWAISDEETFAWKLQDRYPSLNVMNYGTGAYGTYQSLLVLERELPLLNSPVIVLYGFIPHHATRNVGAVDWLEILSRFSRRGIVSVPFATLDEDGALVRHSPKGYPALPFRESSATIALLAEIYMKARAGGRGAQARPVTERILLEMAATSEKFGARFLVVQLEPTRAPRNPWADFLEANQIQYLDCGFPYEEMIVPGEGHPNGDVNTLWADCIAGALGNDWATPAS